MTRNMFRFVMMILLSLGIGACADAQTTVPSNDPLDGATVRVGEGDSQRTYTLVPVGPSTLPTSAPVTQPPPLAGPAPEFRVMLTAGMAPAVIHVSALPNPPVDRSVLVTRYVWSFGNAQGAFNSLVGWNAAHLYRKPGVYTIRLTCTYPDGSIGQSEKQVTISPDTRRRIYVSGEGHDANDGSAETTAVRSLTRAFFLVRDNTTLLFRRGDTFDYSTGAVIKQRNIVLSAFGESNLPPPTLRVVKPDVWEALRTTETSSDILIENLAFDSAFPEDFELKGAARALSASGLNIAMVDCVFSNVRDGVNADRNPTGLLVQGCVAPTVTSLRAYLVWAAGSNLVIVGNRAGNSTREHIVRASRCQSALIAHNDFGNLDRRKHGDPRDILKGAITLQNGGCYYVAQNILRGAPMPIGPLGGRDGIPGANLRTRCVVIEGNRLLGAGIELSCGLEQVMLRNNLVLRDDLFALRLLGSDDTVNDQNQRVYENRTLRDISIVHNTMVGLGKGPQFLQVTGNIPDGELTMENNLMVAPNLATGYEKHAAVYVGKADLSWFGKIAGNLWPVPASTMGLPGAVMYVSDAPLRHTGYLSPQAWCEKPNVTSDRFENITLDETFAPSGDTPTSTSVRSAGTFVDLNGKRRPANNCQVGALEISE